MNKRTQQEEYIRRHAARIVAFAESGHARCGRGIILIGWPGQDSERMIEELVFLDESKVEQLLKQLLIQERETLADRIINAVQQYDQNWEAVIVFLDNIGNVVDLHIAGFIPESQPAQLFAHSGQSATNH